MNKRLGALALAAGMGGSILGGALPASANTTTLTANITAGAIGSRTLTVNPVAAFASVLGNAGMTTTATMIVTETAVQGANPWSVTASSTAFTDTGSNSIAATNLVASPVAPVQVAGGGSNTPSAPGNLGSTYTVWSNSGQNTSTLYTGTYTEALPLTLTPPNGTVASNYTATLTVTLVG